MRTTGQVAKELGIGLWTLLRLVYSGTIPPPARVGQLRAWSETDVENARAALAARGNGAHRGATA
jgi:predicted DNA-binding transcriptional regulator AlpA